MLFYWRYLLFIQFRFIEKYKKPKTLQLQYFFNFVFTYLSTSLFFIHRLALTSYGPPEKILSSPGGIRSNPCVADSVRPCQPLFHTAFRSPPPPSAGFIIIQKATDLSVTFKDIHCLGQVGHRIEHHAVRHGLPFLQGQVREIVHEPLEDQYR